MYAGFGDGEPFAGWLATHIARKRALDHDAMLAIARRGAADSLAAGITTTADYSFSGAAVTAAAELGLRATVYLEVFASDPADAAAQFEATKSRVEESELVRIGVSPHAPYTCSVEVYRWALGLGIPVGTHLAESANENDWLEHGSGPMTANAAVLVAPTGKRAVGTLEEVLCPEPLCAHCVQVEPGAIELLAAHGVPAAHCPRSNAMLGCGIAPLADLRAAGSASGSALTRLLRRRRSTPGRSSVRRSTWRAQANDVPMRSEPARRSVSRRSARPRRSGSTPGSAACYRGSGPT